jgi:hypothetical protein
METLLRRHAPIVFVCRDTLGIAHEAEVPLQATLLPVRLEGMARMQAEAGHAKS